MKRRAIQRPRVEKRGGPVNILAGLARDAGVEDRSLAQAVARMEIPLRRQMAFTQARNMLLVGLLLSLILAGMFFRMVVMDGRAEVDAQMGRLVSATLETSAQAAFSLDQELAERSVQGLFEVPWVLRVVVRDDFGDILAIREREPSGAPPRWLMAIASGWREHYSEPLILHEHNVGRLTVELDSGRIARAMFAPALSAFVVTLTGFFILAGILTAVFYFGVTRPLVRIGRFLSAVDPDHPGERRLDVPRRHKHDELGQLIKSVNGLLRGVEKGIEKRRKDEDLLQQRETHYRSLFENTGTAIISFADDAVIRRCNEQFVSLTGYNRQEVEGRMRWTDFVEPGNMEEIAGYHKRRLAGGEKPPSEYEYWFMDRWGARRAMLVRVTVIPGSRERIASLIDITERKQVEVEILKAKDEAETLSRSKSEFLANMSHEIRTPLNGVLGMLQLLRKAELGEEERKFVEVALGSGRSLLTVINDVLDFSKLDAGSMDKTWESFDPEAPVRVVMNNFAIQAREKGLAMGVEISPETPPLVISDEARVRQILFNLVGNGVKFTERGRVDLSLTPLFHDDQFMLLFTVTDTGIGISDKDIQGVFEAFTQVDGSYTRRYQGTGLGLGIVKRLVDLLGGTLAVSSEAGKGTSVFFTVRADLPKEGDEPMVAEGRVVGLRSLRILVVEDDKVNRLTIKRLLEYLGNEAVCVENGELALLELERSAFDCVFMDIQMPGLDGMETTAAIRSGDRPGINPAVPIVALTAHAMHGDRERFTNAGMDDYLPKPVEVDDLIRVLAKFS